MEITSDLVAMFLVPFFGAFFGIVAGAQYKRWIKRRKRQRATDRWIIDQARDWRGQ
jgi:hypothetical protein